MRRLARYIWVAILVEWSGVAAFVAWECQLTKDHTLMVGPAPGIGRPVTLAEQWATAWSEAPGVAARLVPFAVAFVLIGLGVRYLARRPVDEGRYRAMILAFGWVPGLMIALVRPDFYFAVSTLYVALAGCFTVSAWRMRWVRVVEALAATAIGAAWYAIG